MNKRIGILGYGEIGNSLEQVYIAKGITPLIKDLNRNDGLTDLDILNVCIPGGLQNFTDIVNKEVLSSKASLVIVHSTTRVGVTKTIKNAVHSPVRGIHPTLKQGIETFVKFIGYNEIKYKKAAAEHFTELGIKFKLVFNSDSTELAKLLSTTYYGLCIAFHGEMKKMCDLYDIPFEVISEWTETYNEGYTELKMPKVIRPNLYPPDKTIGGHCVIPNAEILNEIFNSPALDLILNYKPAVVELDKLFA